VNRPPARRAPPGELEPENPDVPVTGEDILCDEVAVGAEQDDPDAPAGPFVEVSEGTLKLLLATIRFPRMSVQRLSAVEAIVGVALRFAFASQVPSCGGGGSLSDELRLSPTALLRKSESSRTRCPPELVPA
jgi:hypothetical protein